MKKPSKSFFKTYVDSVKKNNKLSMVKYQILFRQYTKAILADDKDLDNLRDQIIQQQRKVEQDLKQ